mmetsp:Transcript_18802/g.48042  ORF Transcript_18802/g.48042 Transcript_18802/m.48042 type:complete len:378 (+) Transcript_18802:188-1321(+)
MCAGEGAAQCARPRKSRSGVVQITDEQWMHVLLEADGTRRRQRRPREEVAENAHKARRGHFACGGSVSVVSEHSLAYGVPPRVVLPQDRRLVQEAIAGIGDSSEAHGLRAYTHVVLEPRTNPTPSVTVIAAREHAEGIENVGDRCLAHRIVCAAQVGNRLHCWTPADWQAARGDHKALKVCGKQADLETKLLPACGARRHLAGPHATDELRPDRLRPSACEVGTRLVGCILRAGHLQKRKRLHKSTGIALCKGARLRCRRHVAVEYGLADALWEFSEVRRRNTSTVAVAVHVHPRSAHGGAELFDVVREHRRTRPLEEVERTTSRRIRDLPPLLRNTPLAACRHLLEYAMHGRDVCWIDGGERLAKERSAVDHGTSA